MSRRVLFRPLWALNVQISLCRMTNMILSLTHVNFTTPTNTPMTASMSVNIQTHTQIYITNYFYFVVFVWLCYLFFSLSSPSHSHILHTSFSPYLWQIALSQVYSHFVRTITLSLQLCPNLLKHFSRYSIQLHVLCVSFIDSLLNMTCFLSSVLLAFTTLHFLLTCMNEEVSPHISLQEF